VVDVSLDPVRERPGFPCQALLPYGRDPTSIAFLSGRGTERLYSGVTNSTASGDPRSRAITDRDRAPDATRAAAFPHDPRPRTLPVL
jgi:hypothetical protein